MTNKSFKASRFLLWNKETKELIEVSAKNHSEALQRYGWGKENTVIINKGRKLHLINPIRLGQTVPTQIRSIYDE